MRIFGLRERCCDVFGIGATVQGAAALTGSALQYESAQNALGLQSNEFNTTQANEAPWLQAGQTALGQLSEGTAPGGALTQPYGQTFNPGQFQAPTGLTEQNDPGFQARLQLGQQQLEGAEAAQGVTGGGALQAAEQYGQTFATNDYQNVYNNALNTYNANYQSGLGAFNTNYNVYQNNQANQFNRLASIAGLGQTATGQLANAGQAAATNSTNLLTQQGNALSSGATGVGNAIQSGISGYQNNQILQGVLNQSGYGSGSGGYPSAGTIDTGEDD